MGFGVIDCGAAPVPSPLLPELELVLLELPVLDFPQSQESDFELLSVLVSSFLSHPELEVDELELLDDDDDEPDVPEELELELEVDDDEELDVLEELELDELPPQLSPSLAVESVDGVEVLPQPSSATGAVSPVSS